MERQYINPPDLFNPEEQGWPYTHGIRVGNTLYIAGQVGMTKDIKVVPGGAEEQARVAWESIKSVVEAAGGKITDVVQVVVYLQNIDDIEAEHRVRASLFPKGRMPVATVVQVAKLGYPGLLMEVHATAVLDG